MKLLVLGDIHGKTKKLEKEIPKHDFDFVIGVGDYAGIEEWRSYIKYTLFKKGESNMEGMAKRKSPEEFYGKKRFKELLKKDYEAGRDTLTFLDMLGKPGFFVFGNGDDDWYTFPFGKNIMRIKKRNLNVLNKLKNIKNINYGVRKYKGITFLGFGGYLDATANDKSRDEKWQNAVDKRMGKAEKKFNYFLKKVKGKSIFIFHYPPMGVFDIIRDKKNPYHGGSTGSKFYCEGILKNHFWVCAGIWKSIREKRNLEVH